MSQRVTIEQLADWLKARDEIALIGHVFPDGDATGSTLALWHALKAMGKQAVVCLPGGKPSLYDWLPGADSIFDTEEGTLPFVPNTAMSVDVSERGRLGEGGMKLFDSCPFQGVLDHHKTNEGFGQLYAVDGDAAAVAELVVDLIDALGVQMDEKMAECLFVAISGRRGCIAHHRGPVSYPIPGPYQAVGCGVGRAGDFPGRQGGLVPSDG